MSEKVFYTICVQGHLSPQWADWFENMAIIHCANGQTLLIGPVEDQPALYGLLLKLRDLGLPLLRLECDQYTC